MNNTTITNKELHMATGAILCGQIASYYFEELKHTSLFKHDLKNSLNQTLKKLVKIETDYFDKIDEIDDNQLAHVLSSNLMCFVNLLQSGRLFQDFTTLQEIVMAYDLNPKAIKGISDKIHKENNAKVIKG